MKNAHPNEVDRWVLINGSLRTKLRFAAAIQRKFPDLKVREALARVPEWIEDLVGTELEQGVTIKVVAPGDAIPAANHRITSESVLTGAAFFGERNLPLSWAGDDESADVRLQSGSLLQRMRTYAQPGSRRNPFPNARHFYLCLG